MFSFEYWARPDIGDMAKWLRQMIANLRSPVRLWVSPRGPDEDKAEVGLVAQGIRARGYELRCRGFESLLARDPPDP